MTKTKSIYNDSCLISGEKMQKILNLGMHPYADTFVSEDQLTMTEPVFPLECLLNPNTGQVQLANITNAFDRYNLYAYSYTSANSNFAKNHWKEYYETINTTYNIKDSIVVEIGANDGYLSQFFLNENNKVIAVDSSKEMCDISAQKGVISQNKIFDYDVSNLLVKDFGKAKLVIANNVFNHSNDPVDFAKGVSNLLTEDGIFVFELPYWKATFESDKFDQIYHEHVSYFTIKSSYHLLKKAGLDLIDFEEVDYHGGSIRVFAKLSKDGYSNTKVLSAIKEEENIGLFEVETYKKWFDVLRNKRDIFLRKLYDIKINNPEHKIIGVGAAAKANTFLNFYNIDGNVMDFITDSSIYKQGKFTPLTRIPIEDDNIFKDYEKVFAIILSWNISDSLKQTLININPKIKFISTYDEKN
jgi:SAM-dependent methyltransferase